MSELEREGKHRWDHKSSFLGRGGDGSQSTPKTKSDLKNETSHNIYVVLLKKVQPLCLDEEKSKRGDHRRIEADWNILNFNICRPISTLFSLLLLLSPSVPNI